MRYGAKIDDNQPAIVEALVKHGAWVKSTAALGGGFPDLLVWHPDTKWTVLEVKRNGPPSAAKLTPAEADFHKNCPGPIYIVQTPDEAVGVVVHGVGRKGNLAASRPTLTQTIQDQQAIVNRWEADRASRNGDCLPPEVPKSQPVRGGK